MTQAFDPAEVRLGLKKLSISDPAPLDAAQKRYAAFYGVDFTAEFPGLRQGMGYFDAAGERVAASCFMHPEPAGCVIICHGYFDHLALYGHLIRWCLGHRLSVLGWDLPGHGLSTGPRASIESFDRYVEVLETVMETLGEDLPQPLHVMGQSTGGAIIMEYLLREGYREANSPFGEVVLLAPLVRPAHWHRVEVLFRLVRNWVSEMRRGFKVNSNDPEFLHFLKHEDPLQSHSLPTAWLDAMHRWIPEMLAHTPTDISPMVIQGIDDHTVDWRYNIEVIRDKFRDPELVLLGRGRHHLVNDSERVRGQYMAALDQRFGFA